MALARAILAVLVDQPCSGYGLYKRFKGSIDFYWKASYQQIYQELTKLKEEGLLQAQTIPQEHRQRRRFTC